MAKTNIEREQDIAKANKWTRLGNAEVEVWQPLTDSDRADLAEVQSECLHQISELRDRRAVFVKQNKADVEKIQGALSEAADQVRMGGKHVEKILPCFYDPSAHQRVFIDPETGEEVARKKATEEDRQLRIA